MGNKNSKKDEIETILNDAYKNTDIEFSSNELTNLKLRIRDAENYFQTKFEIFYNFNNFIIKDGLYYLYENFNQKIESFSKHKCLTKNFNVLIDFEDESLIIAQGIKIDFEALFVIIFEKLEINIVLFFYMTNVDSDYVSDFFSQMTESADLFKYYRKFDCLYFLFPNLDYFIKNDCSLVYLSNKPLNDYKFFYNDEIYIIENEFSEAVFQFKEKLITSRYPKTDAHNYIEYLLEKISPTYIKIYTTLTFMTKLENFIVENEDQLTFIEYIADICPMNLIEIELNEWMDTKIFELFIKKIILFLDKSRFEETFLYLKIVLKNNSSIQNKEERFKLKMIHNYVKNIIKDLYFYNQIHNKRKIVIELFEIIIDEKQSPCSIRKNNNDEKTSISLNTNQYPVKKYREYFLIFEKLLICWFLKNENENKFKNYLSIIFHNEKLKKLNNKNIIDNIIDFVSPCYRTNYKQRTKKISKFELQEILK